MGIPLNRVLALLCVVLPAAGLAACGTTSTAFKGEQHEVAQVISILQTDARNADEQKVCTNDLAAALVRGLDSANGGCREAIKKQLSDVDSFNLTIHSVQVNAAQKKPTASAVVTSIYSGKTRASTLLLVKEAGKWKVSGVQ